MCGINGLIGRDPSAVAAMNEAVIHRGPDETGIAASDSWTIGMDRLAIIDLSPAGHQPMTTADGRYTIVFNGEIYNYRELKAELRAEGAVFRGDSDTEVVLEGYARWGAEVAGRLRGMWAFAIRDEVTGRIFLSRDPFGIKPLYLYRDGGFLAFSSEIKGLLAHPRVRRALSSEAIRDVLMFGYVMAPHAILEGVRALLPGEELAIAADGTVSGALVRRLEAPRRAAPTDDELFVALEDSVRHHLIADVPVGLFFSGGVDSTALAVLLKRLGVRLKAYHVMLRGRDDTRYARAIAERLGLDLTLVPFGAEDVPGVIEKFWRVMDQPLADASLLPTWLVSERAATDVKVVLSGEGGDELFAGYRRHARLPTGRSRSFLAGLDGTVVRRAIRSFPRLAYGSPTLAGMERRSRRAIGDALGSYLAETAIALPLVSERQARETIAARLDGRESEDGVLAYDRLVYLPDDLLAKIDVASMAASLEGRVPFLDREVFRLVGGAPLAWKSAEVTKQPLKRLLRSVLPADLVDRPKSGFSLPLAPYVLDAYEDELVDAIRWYLAECQGIEPTLDAVLRYAAGDRARRNRLSGALAYECFALLTLHRFAMKIT